jgi:hypothetical protein
MLVATMLAALLISQVAMARSLPDPSALPNMPTEIGVSSYHVEMDGNAVDADGPTPGTKKDEDCDGVDPDATPYDPCEVYPGETGNYKGGEDWETLNTESNKTPGTYSGAASLREFVTDSPRINTQFPGVYADDKNDLTVYRGNSCKDVDDLANCVNAAKGFPNKDDIENAYAAIFLNQVERPIWVGLGADGTPICMPYSGIPPNPNHPTGPYANCEWHEIGDVLLYMGLDLAVGNGSASLGAWLMDRDVPQPPDGETFGSLGFTREDGDLAIIANFEDGGRSYELLTFRYRGPDCQSKVDAEQGPGVVTCEGPLEPLVREGGEGGLCTQCFPQCNGLSCAISNTGPLKQGNTVLDEGVGPVFAPWPYVPAPSEVGKTPDGHFPTTTFFEGFVNLTALYRSLDEELGCFSNFIYETRASHSIDAELHDWVAGELPLCGLEINKSGDEVAKRDPSDNVTYSYILTNTGVVPLDLVWVADYLTGFTPTNYENENSAPADNGTTIKDHLGDLTSTVTSECGATLPADNPATTGVNEGQCTFDVMRAMQNTDPDPMQNTTIAVYSYGSARTSAEESHSVDLFTAGVQITKTGPAVAKVGDQVTYSFDITNLSDGDLETAGLQAGAPNLEMNLQTDALKGISDSVLDDATVRAAADTAGCDVLTFNETCSFTVDYTIPAGDPPRTDPLVNTVTIHYGVADVDSTTFDNDVTDSDTHSVDLFTAAVEIIKSGEDLSKEGDPVIYDFTITNKSDGDLTTTALDGTAPNLELDSISDTVLGNLITAAQGATPSCSTLSQGQSCHFQVNRNVQSSDPDPLPNTVTVHYDVADVGDITFNNDVMDSDSHSVNLFTPSIDVTKTCKPEGGSVGQDVKLGQNAVFEITITNNSSTDTPTLTLDSITDTLRGASYALSVPTACDSLNDGNSCTITITTEANATDLAAGSISNSVEVHYDVSSVTTPIGPKTFENDITDNDSASCDVIPPTPGKIVIEKVSIGGEGSYGYTTTQGCPSALEPCGFPPSGSTFNLSTAIGAPTTGSPFGAVPNPAGDGFASTAPDYVVQTTYGAATPYSVNETSLELGTTFVSLVCQEDGTQDTGISGTTANILVDEGETVTCRYTNTFPTQGCTPGFWQGGFGEQLWDQGPPDADWTTYGGNGTNPFIHSTLFNSFFASHPDLAGKTMLDLVGTGGGSKPAQKAARDVVAAYLNASWGMNFGLTPTQVADMWAAAVAAGTGGAFNNLHTTLSEFNMLGCPIP